MRCSAVETPAPCPVQVIPSGLVKATPPDPTAAKSAPLNATDSRSAAVFASLEVHAEPSGLVRTVPDAPTATNVPCPNATPSSRFPWGIGFCHSQSPHWPERGSATERHPAAQKTDRTRVLNIFASENGRVGDSPVDY